MSYQRFSSYAFFVPANNGLPAKTADSAPLRNDVRFSINFD